jgi:hypothetical protein
MSDNDDDLDIEGASDITTAAEWKQNSDAPVPVTVPSGNTCLARKPGMRAFVKAGLIPNSLLPIVMRAVRKQAEPDFKELEGDGGRLQDMIRLMDNVVVHCVMEPRVHPTPPQEDLSDARYDEDFERDEDKLYVDQVDPDDKAFLFQWACGGTSDLEQFREQSEQLLAGASGGQDVRRPAKRAARPAKKSVAGRAKRR